MPRRIYSGGHLWNTVRTLVRSPLRDQLMRCVTGETRYAISVTLWGRIREQLGDRLEDSLQDRLRDETYYREHRDLLCEGRWDV